MRKILIIFLITILFLGCYGGSPIGIIEEEPQPEPEPTTYINRFSITVTLTGTTTPLSIDYPIITYDDGIIFNIETMEPNVNGLPVKTTYTETERIISIHIDVDTYSQYYFVNNNMINKYGIDPANMSLAEFQEMLTFLYDPTPPLPDYTDCMYSLFGVITGYPSDNFIVGHGQFLINGISYRNEDFPYVGADPVIVQIQIYVDTSDSFFWFNNNALTYFNIDLSCMTLDELIIMADLIKRYPEESWMDLKAEYNP